MEEGHGKLRAVADRLGEVGQSLSEVSQAGVGQPAANVHLRILGR